MPGDNCAVVGCGSCRRSKGIGIWKLPAPRNEEYKKWRADWLNELTKSRKVDDDNCTASSHFGMFYFLIEWFNTLSFNYAFKDKFKILLLKFHC